MKIIRLVIGISVLYVSTAFAAENNQSRVSELKSFFTSPQQRAELDRLRTSGVFSGQETSQTSQVMAHKPLEVKLNGVVYSETGMPVIWVNNKSTLKSESIDESIRVRASAVKSQTGKVPVKVNEKWLKLKPGQTWRESRNQVQENYQIKQVK